MATTRKTAEKPATAPQEPIPTPRASRNCLCRCGEKIYSPKGIFRPGHDAKAVGKLTRAVVAGEMTEAEALATIAPASDLLKAKISRAIARHLAMRATETPAETAN